MGATKDEKAARSTLETQTGLSKNAARFGHSDLSGQLVAHDGPQYATNSASKMGFVPAASVVFRGSRGVVERHHLWRLCKEDTTLSSWNRFEPHWKKQQLLSQPSVLRAAIGAFKSELLTSVLLLIVFAASQYALPLLMPYLITWFTYNTTLPLWWVFVYAAAIFASGLCGSLFNFHSRMLTYRFGLRVRAAVTTLVYRKSIYAIKGRTQTSGMVVNLMSTDALVIMETLPNFMVGVIAPIQIAVTLGLLSRYIQAFALVSLAVAALATPFVGFLSANIAKLRARMQSHSDTRLRYIKELLTAIRIIKYYAWELPFIRSIGSAREDQLKKVRSIQLTRALLITLLTNVASLGIGFTFFFYGLKNKTMSYETTFSALAFLAMLRIPFNYLPLLLAYLGQYFNSFDRITFYALCSEITPRTPDADPKGEKGMKITNATFSWETDLSIAESRYMDIELQESKLNQQIEMADDTDLKAEQISRLRELLEEKEYIDRVIRILRLRQRRDTQTKSVAALPIRGVHQVRIDVDEQVDDEEEVLSPEEKTRFPLRSVVPSLRDVTLNVRCGSLTAVVGSVGSGKSTIAMAFLGEIQPSKGTVSVSGEIAYASQEPWILNATIRENITFGRKYDSDWYAKVIHACALAPDLASFPASDLTEIGERGSNLSGGQRQRINVARAMYSKSPTVIFDDPFSAVDAHVGAHMFENVVVAMRNAGRTVLLITNQLHLVSDADYIAVLKAGRIVEQGTCVSLLKLKDGYLKKMLSKHVVQKTSENQEELDSSRPGSHSMPINTPFEISPEKDEENKLKGSLIQAEERKLGNITFGTYWTYFKAGGLILVLLIFLMQSLRMAARVMGGVWLSWWSDPKNEKGLKSNVYLGGYMAFVLGEAFFTLLGSMAFIQFALAAARVLHQRMVDAISHATTRWYDQTPVGRVLTRFSKDIDFVDIKLPQVVEQATAFGFILLSVAVSIAIGSPFVVILLAIAAIVFTVLVIYYRSSSIQIQRLEALSRAPIYTHLTETMDGAVTIRAYGMAERFKIANMNKIDRNNVDFVALRYCASWYGITQDLVGNLFVTLSIIALILVRTYAPETISVGYMIFALSNVGSISSALSDFSSTLTDLENKMNSAERVLEYCSLPQEAPSEIPENKPPPEWPDAGAISFRDVSIKYGDDDSESYALRGVSCKIRPGEKIGIVGRTGAGKSTLVTALFRTTEPASGKITIDKVDISKIGLFDLRSRLSIIPQLPQLFVGTVRYNLDPFDEHSDNELWNALKMVRLRDHVASFSAALYEQIDENGSIFSVGQRQLLSMARCLLRGTHVLVLDEATSAVDVETDALLQTMIRKNFVGTTVLTIAHRLNTIMDSDRIMVLDAGKVVEFDTPRNLVGRQSILRGMVEATGPETSDYLKSIANGDVSFIDALSALVEEDSSIEELYKSRPSTSTPPGSMATPRSTRRPAFAQLTRRQQSKLVLGYYKVEEEEVMQRAQARALFAAHRLNAIVGAGPVRKSPSKPVRAKRRVGDPTIDRDRPPKRTQAKRARRVKVTSIVRSPSGNATGSVILVEPAMAAPSGQKAPVSTHVFSTPSVPTTKSSATPVAGVPDIAVTRPSVPSLPLNFTTAVASSSAVAATPGTTPSPDLTPSPTNSILGQSITPRGGSWIFTRPSFDRSRDASPSRSPGRPGSAIARVKRVGSAIPSNRRRENSRGSVLSGSVSDREASPSRVPATARERLPPSQVSPEERMERAKRREQRRSLIMVSSSPDSAPENILLPAISRRIRGADMASSSSPSPPRSRAADRQRPADRSGRSISPVISRTGSEDPQFLPPSVRRLGRGDSRDPREASRDSPSGSSSVLPTIPGSPPSHPSSALLPPLSPPAVRRISSMQRPTRSSPSSSRGSSPTRTASPPGSPSAKRPGSAKPSSSGHQPPPAADPKP